MSSLTAGNGRNLLETALLLAAVRQSQQGDVSEVTSEVG